MCIGRMILRFAQMIALLMVVSGCTTVKTFQRMTPDQRAVAVCKRQVHILASVQQKQALEAQIADSTQALNRGYRVHKQCQQVKVYGPAKVSCSSSGNYTDCTESRSESYETRCVELPVSLSFELEKSKIEQWTRSLSSVNERLESDWQQCYRSVYTMSPEEAYQHYVHPDS